MKEPWEIKEYHIFTEEDLRRIKQLLEQEEFEYEQKKTAADKNPGTDERDQPETQSGKD